MSMCHLQSQQLALQLGCNHTTQLQPITIASWHCDFLGVWVMTYSLESGDWRVCWRATSFWTIPKRVSGFCPLLVYSIPVFLFDVYWLSVFSFRRANLNINRCWDPSLLSPFHKLLPSLPLLCICVPCTYMPSQLFRKPFQYASYPMFHLASNHCQWCDDFLSFVVCVLIPLSLPLLWTSQPCNWSPVFYSCSLFPVHTVSTPTTSPLFGKTLFLWVDGL